MSLLFVSCAPRRSCYPTKKSKDYAKVLKLVPMQKGYMHSVAEDTLTHDRYYAYYECLPDSVRVGSIVNITGYARLKTGSGMKLSFVPGLNKSNTPIKTNLRL